MTTRPARLTERMVVPSKWMGACAGMAGKCTPGNRP
jgi:hypothetical protein